MSLLYYLNKEALPFPLCTLILLAFDLGGTDLVNRELSAPVHAGDHRGMTGRRAGLGLGGQAPQLPRPRSLGSCRTHSLLGPAGGRLWPSVRLQPPPHGGLDLQTHLRVIHLLLIFCFKDPSPAGPAPLPAREAQLPAVLPC